MTSTSMPLSPDSGERGMRQNRRGCVKGDEAEDHGETDVIHDVRREAGGRRTDKKHLSPESGERTFSSVL